MSNRIFSKVLKIKLKFVLWTLLILVIVLFILGGLIFHNWKKNQPYSKLPDFKPLGLNQDITKDLKEEKVYSILKDQTGFNDLYIFFSPDGEKVAYAISKDGGWAVVVNGQVGAAYDSLGVIIFSPDSQHFAYTAKKNNKEFIVLDNQAGPAFDWTFEPKTFTPDSRFFIYKARRESKDLMMINNWSSQLYDEIYRLTYSSDNSQLFIFARQGQDFSRLSINLDKSKELK
ncbi:MAG: hypothetical protein NTX66_02540 [Candidatus Falkowbacteria bacterium]|nr:hypothetical protein [Candidatus Falkowbacteria bacterium]